jgi:hypothetical protein
MTLTTISVTKVDGSTEQVASNQAVVVHGVDANGVYLGLVDPSVAARAVSRPPPEQGEWRWNAVGGWTPVPNVEEARAQALADIDSAAGLARQRYITVAPGQEGTYLVKAQQAADFMARGGTPPPYVQAEADAMGSTPAQAAQLILGLAQQWNEVVGPAIERARRAGKIAVEAAVGLEDVQAATAAALAAIGQI